MGSVGWSLSPPGRKKIPPQWSLSSATVHPSVVLPTRIPMSLGSVRPKLGPPTWHRWRCQHCQGRATWFGMTNCQAPTSSSAGSPFLTLQGGPRRRSLNLQRGLGKGERGRPLAAPGAEPLHFSLPWLRSQLHPSAVHSHPPTSSSLHLWSVPRVCVSVSASQEFCSSGSVPGSVAPVPPCLPVIRGSLGESSCRRAKQSFLACCHVPPCLRSPPLGVCLPGAAMRSTNICVRPRCCHPA